MNEPTIDESPRTYITPKVLATFEAGEILAEAETGSVVIIVS